MPIVKLIKILLGALGIFLAISMAQEWHVFRPWILREKPLAPTLSAGDRKAIEGTLRTYLSMSAHFHATGGDPRFGERIPAAPWLVDDLRNEVEYLRKNARQQTMTLLKFDLLGIERVSADRASVSTKEYWVIRTSRLDGQGEADPPRSEIIWCDYRMQRTGQSWQVQGWEAHEPPPAEPAAGQPERGSR